MPDDSITVVMGLSLRRIASQSLLPKGVALRQKRCYRKEHE